MGFLGAFPRAVEIRLWRQVIGAEALFDMRPGRGDGLVAEVGRVGAHIGDVASLVQSLGQGHGFADAESEPGARGLLQRRGDQRRARPRSRGLVLALAHHIVRAAQHRERLVGGLLVARAEVLAGLAEHLASELLLRAGFEIGEDFPILFRVEGADFPCRARRSGARPPTAPGPRKAPGNLGPEQRGEHVADHTVEKAPRLLLLDIAHIDLAGVGEGLADRLAGDLVEDDPAEAAWVAADGFLQMPGDGLAFPVPVAGEIDRLGARGDFLQLLDDLFLAGEDFVARPPAVRVDAEPLD